MRQGLIINTGGILNSDSYGLKADELADKIIQKIREGKNRITLY
jgi:hypothetical protein